MLVREWDLTRGPGPAAGRGIVATPALLIDDVHVLLGVPTDSDLLQRCDPPGDTQRRQ